MPATLPIQIQPVQTPSYFTHARSRVQDDADTTLGIVEYPGLFDALAVLSPSHTLSITPYPVEDSADVIASGELSPARLTLNGAVDPVTGKAAETWQTLIRLQREREMVTIATPVAVYHYMIISRIQTQHSFQTQDGLVVTLELQQMSVANDDTNQITLPTVAQDFTQPTYVTPTVLEVLETSFAPIYSYLDEYGK